MAVIYYLAYGSNLNKADMKVRCPFSQPVGQTVLLDYQLVFRRYLTVEKKKGFKVPLGIWELDRENEKQLDYYEAYPSLYRKEYIEVELNGKKVLGLIYLMNEGYPIKKPDQSYVQTCLAGYLDFNFDSDILKQALARCQAYLNKE